MSAVAAIEGRLLGATADEIAAAVDCGDGRARAPAARRAATAVRVARETPLALGLDDDTLVEGVVDVAFEERTAGRSSTSRPDVELAGRRDEYARQVSPLRARRCAAATRQAGASGPAAASDFPRCDARATRRARRRATHGTARRSARHR